MLDGAYLTGYVHLKDLPWDAKSYRHGMLAKLNELPFKVRLFVVVSSTGDTDWVITNPLEDPLRPMTTRADQ